MNTKRPVSTSGFLSVPSFMTQRGQLTDFTEQDLCVQCIAARAVSSLLESKFCTAMTSAERRVPIDSAALSMALLSGPGSGSWIDKENTFN